MGFSQPSAGGETFEPKDYIGALVLVYPKKYNPNEATKHGPTTSADVDVVVVDRQNPDGSPVVRRNARLFGNLANSVRDGVGDVVLGRIGQVPTNKGNPAWVLESYTDEDAVAAAPVDAAFKAGNFNQPQPGATVPDHPTPPGAASPVAAAPAAVQGGAPAPTADPNVAKLIGAGLDAAQVVAMDPATRAAVAATL